MGLYRKIENIQAGGIAQGYLPTPDTISAGTVQMEQHPSFDLLIELAQNYGFEVTISEGITEAYTAVTAIVSFLDKAEQQVIRSLVLSQGMRFIDLEHEIGHVKQFARLEANGSERYTSILHKSRRGEDLNNREHGVLAKWQRTILEFDNRLEEYIRLSERNIDRSILFDHALGIIKWSQLCFKKGVKRWKSQSRYDWLMKNCPDFFENRQKVHALIRQKFPSMPPVF